MKKHILIIEDEADIASALSARLKNEGFSTSVADNGNDGLDLALEEDYDLAIIDIMLPGIDGLEIISRLQKTKNTAILILSARSQEEDVISGLNIGADDYVTKPFSAREVVARVHTLLRRKDTPLKANSTQLTFGNLTICPTAYTVTIDHKFVHTTPTEFRILNVLASHPNDVYTRRELVEQLTYSDSPDHTQHDQINEIPRSHLRTVDSHIRSLRKKIGAHFIRTVHAVGYSFNPSENTNVQPHVLESTS